MCLIVIQAAGHERRPQENSLTDWSHALDFFFTRPTFFPIE